LMWMLTRPLAGFELALIPAFFGSGMDALPTCYSGIGSEAGLGELELVMVLAVGGRGDIRVWLVFEVLVYGDGVGPAGEGGRRHAAGKFALVHREGEGSSVEGARFTGWWRTAGLRRGELFR